MNLVPKSDPILVEKIAPFAADPRTLRAVAFEMFKTMVDKRGAGIAAPQVGLRHRMFVMRDHGQPFRDAYVCINPEVISASEEVTHYREGCLTFPGMTVPITRPRSIVASWTDLRGKRQERELYNMLARCFLHELDHLNGMLLIPAGTMKAVA